MNPLEIILVKAIRCALIYRLTKSMQLAMPICEKRRLHLLVKYDRRIIPVIMTTETIQFQATPEFRQSLESEAAKLQLSLSAYIVYMHARLSPSADPARLDRQVQEVFGKHGDLIRRLA